MRSDLGTPQADQDLSHPAGIGVASNVRKHHIGLAALSAFWFAVAAPGAWEFLCRLFEKAIEYYEWYVEYRARRRRGPSYY